MAEMVLTTSSTEDNSDDAVANAQDRKEYEKSTATGTILVLSLDFATGLIDSTTSQKNC